MLWSSAIADPVYFLDPVEFVSNINQPSKEDTFCLAKAIYFEARNQDFSTKVAVATVVLNRVRSWGKYENPCQAVFDGCNFSWVCQKHVPSDPLALNQIHEKDSWENALAIAKNLIVLYNRDTNFELTDGATYFHEVHLDPYPSWVTTKYVNRTIQFDSLVFYKRK